MFAQDTQNVSKVNGPNYSLRLQYRHPAIGGALYYESRKISGRQAKMTTLNVLLVEDDPLLNRFLRDMFEREPVCTIHAVRTQAEAHAFFDKTIPDVAVVDGILTDGSAFSLVEAIRRRSESTRIIGMSASVTGETVKAFEAHGADATVDKRDFAGLLRLVRDSGSESVDAIKAGGTETEEAPSKSARL